MVKISLPVAAKRRKKQNLSNRHLTTTDFFKASVNYFLECVPNDKLNVHIRDFVQGYPLAGANLGQFQHHLHGFYVPFRTIMENFNDFIVGNPVARFGEVTELADGMTRFDYGAPMLQKFESKVVEKVPQMSTCDLFYLLTSNYDSEQASWHFPEFVRRLQDRDINQTEEFMYANMAANASPLLADRDYSGGTYGYAFSTINVANYNFLSQRYDVLTSFSVTYSDNTSVSVYLAFNLSHLGRYVWTLLNSIGFTPHFTVPAYADLSADSLVLDNLGIANDSHLQEFSALPVLALMKLWVDWFIPSKFRNDYDIKLRELGRMGHPFRRHIVDTTPTLQTTRGLRFEDIFNYMMYPSDYFTNAFLYPNGSNDGETEGIILRDITAPQSADVNLVMQVQSGEGQSNTPYIGSDGDASGPAGLTTYSLRALRALQNFVTRNKIAGYRTIDRFLAQFGTKLSYTETNRSLLIKSELTEFFPQVVMSQTDSHDSDVQPTPESQQALLGGRASNLIFGGDLKLSFDVDEPGIFIVISSVNPKVGYVQGLDRMYLHKDKLDFYQPSFDSLGVQAIVLDELVTSVRPSGDGGNYSGRIFGYAPRYAEYKTKQDRLTGDFQFGNRNAFLESLHTFRIFDEIPRSISQQFLIGESSVYDRIFQFITDEYDHFQLASYNDVRVQRPTDTMSDAEEITDGNGRYIDMSIGGNHQLR